MNLAHIHIVLNHVPSLGSVLGLAMLVWATYTKNESLKKFSFGLLAVVALATLPTYLSGNAARQVIAKEPNALLGVVEVHQNGAMLTLVAMTFAGAFAWFGLWEIRRFSHPGSLTTWGTLLTSAAASALILYTANIGGKIRHIEIREAADSAITQSVGWKPAVEEFLARAWVIPAVATLHYVGMVLLFGVSLLLMLRVVGVMKSIPFSGIHRLLPLAIFGFVVNVFTGMLFYLQSPEGYVHRAVFQLKIGCILLAALPVLYFTVFDDPWKTGSGRSASALTKIAGIGAFFLLVAAIIYGRLIFISY